MAMQKCTKCGKGKFIETIITLHPNVSICGDGVIEHDYDSEEVNITYPEPHYICMHCDTSHQIIEGGLCLLD